MRTAPDTILRLIAYALGALVIVFAALEFQKAVEADREREDAATVSDDPLRRALQRCRSLLPEDLAADANCQAAWAENRSRFFGTATQEKDE